MGWGDILLNKYIFIYIEKDTTIEFLKENGSLLYLEDIGGDGKLSGQNYDFARWILEINGLLGVSTAVLEEGLTKIVDGPLLRVKDYIKKYDRRNRNCLVFYEVAGAKIETWLPFKWEENDEKR